MFLTGKTQKADALATNSQINISKTKFIRTPEAEFTRVCMGEAPPVSKISNVKSAGFKPAAQVLQAFNTWSFKREQPDTAESLLAQVTAAMQARRPIRFLLYWGKGPRHAMAEPEETCLDYLASMTRRVAAHYPFGAEFKLILTDTHAELNGHSPADVSAYFAGVAKAAAQRGFSICRMSEILAEHDPQGIHVFDGELRSDPIFEKLMVCASKWYFGDDCAEGGAEHYYRANLQEKRAVEIAFPDGIFVTFNGSDFRALFPETLPIFFMYSIKRGCAVKPWFMAGEGAVAA